MNAFSEGNKVQVDGATHEGHFFTFFEEVHGRGGAVPTRDLLAPDV